ncbi:response regulator transcription factor [Streptomyces sp. NPDC005435]|uniref:helix-turn-helix transcriptional regulator n=1 Tax=Streptomyces sp. NPDC005435 TaxID=3154464 RepID=UPI0034526865
MQTQLRRAGGFDVTVVPRVRPAPPLLAHIEADVLVVDLRPAHGPAPVSEPPVPTLLPALPVCAYVQRNADVRLLGRGVSRFLYCDTPPAELVTTLRDLAGRRESPARLPLSPREREVLELVGRGLTNTEIAQALHLSPTTVKSHISTILRKLGVSNRIQAATLFAVRAAA